MLRWRGFESVPTGWGRCVVTIGVYDGVHRGHQVTLRHVMDRARAADLPSVVVTFEPHPLVVLRPGMQVPVLTPLAYKAELLEELGIDALCIVPFTREFSRLEPDEFAHHMLVANLHAAAVVVGSNFRFGHRAAGDVDLLAQLGQQYGFAVESIDLAGTADTTWSSTYIRSCIEAGDVASAAQAFTASSRDCASTSWGLKASAMQVTVRLVRLRVTVVLAQGHRSCAHQCALGGGQKGIPDVQDQDRPRLVATVPGLVLNGVIEHPRLTGLPLASLRADPKAAARWDHER